MSRPQKGPQATPGQIDLAGNVKPDEPANRWLLNHGFRGWRDQGAMRYTDPFRPTVHLDTAKAKKLLRQRMEVVGHSGWRVRHPQTRHSEVRVGQRRATREGAWHELRAATGEATTGKACAPGYWIIDGATAARVWPLDEQRAAAIAIDDEADLDD